MTPSTMAALLTVLTLAFLLIDFITLLIARIVDPRLRQEVHADNA
jgi:ABC-type dipeptide/oligopeptide/nickel transport system permease component